MYLLSKFEVYNTALLISQHTVYENIIAYLKYIEFLCQWYFNNAVQNTYKKETVKRESSSGLPASMHFELHSSEAASQKDDMNM